jgi:hypothetical protein
MFWQHVDSKMGVLVAAMFLAVFGTVAFLPKPVAPVIQEKEIQRQVRASIIEHKKEKPKPPPEQKHKLAEEKKPEPVPQRTIAASPTLHQATAQLASLHRIEKATHALGNLLAALAPSTGRKGGSLSALPYLPTANAAPAPVPGLGGNGPGGSIGPITKGAELLRGGGGGSLLAGATAGHGGVNGVPISMPKRLTQVRGSIDRDAVLRIVNEHAGEMSACYERGLLKDPNLGAGKVLVEWTIDTKGSVGEARSKSSTLASGEVVSCLLDVLRGLSFPKPEGGVVIVTFPFLFNSVGY